MDLQINCTEDGIKTYPMHKHKNCEIMFYLEGTGCLRTELKDYPFSAGTVIIVPPGIKHGSTSKNGFKNISICGKLWHLLNFSKPVALTDNSNGDGKKLVEMIYANRFANSEYLTSLVNSYIYCLLQSIKTETGVKACVNRIVSEISDNAFDESFNTTDLLIKSGYAEDYIRNRFKQITGMTPIEFLTDIRIKRACFLINIYADTLSLSEIAEKSGFTDYFYFSKKFKRIIGISPTEYKRNLTYEQLP